MSGLRLRHLVFTGPNVAQAELSFEDGLNIIYGASNTGKSFTAKAILFMLGAIKALPETTEIAAYDKVWLGLTLPDRRNVTLYRPARGGPFRLFDGLVTSEGSSNGLVLKQKHDSKRTDTVSYLLLDAVNLAGKQIVRDGDGKKDGLSIHLLSPYAVVSEEDIIAEKSPVFTSGIPSQRTFEQNLFKLILTGIDDAAAVTVPKPSARKVAKAAKIELVDELIAQIDAELGDDPPNQLETEEQLSRLDMSARDLSSNLREVQKGLDERIVERRSVAGRHADLHARAGELDLTLKRFASLKEVYSSDLGRLQSIEEGGFVLVAMVGKDCPVCGAPPEAQTHNHVAEEVAIAQRAAAAEARKIEREQLELGQTMASLEAEAGGLARMTSQLSAEISELDVAIGEMRPREASLRESYELFAAKRAEVVKIIELHQRRALLIARRGEIEAESTKREGDTPQVGPDSTTAFKFGETLKDVLTAWRFPDADKVQFDGKTGDVTVAGKRRAANGKGVRAILRAAFNVAVIVYCVENNRPHPGFLVLDTPLLTYREPLKSKYGELSEDEEIIASTSLAEHFYKHLASLKNDVQFIVIENSTPPAAIDERFACITRFTHAEENGRFGLLARSDAPLPRT